MSDQHPYGQPYGQPQYDQYGQPQYAEPAYAQQAQAPQAWGQQQYQQPGHPPYAQPGYDQYGQPPYAQPGYDEYGQPAYGQQPYGPTGYGGAPALAHWGLRVGSALLDALVVMAPGILLAFVGGVLAAATGSEGLAVLLVGLGYLASIGVGLWNATFRQGRTGQSVGKSVVGTRLLSDRTGQPLGAGMTFVRGLAHVLDSWSLMIGFLWPLWDAKRQTFADKVIGSVVVKG